MPSALTEHAIAIWKAGVAAVDSEQLVRRCIKREDNQLHVADSCFDLAKARRIEIVGGGKAGTGMAKGCLRGLSHAELPGHIKVGGWVNVPADCVDSSVDQVTLHAARPAGVNEPTAEGVVGTEALLQRIQSLEPDDICIVLISGGGSALLPAPVQGISLADKLQVTKTLAAAGAPIEELNLVRRNLSAVKGGRLLQNCGSQNVVCLLISDIVADPIDLIASGPTVHSCAEPERAIDLLNQHVGSAEIPASVLRYLNSDAARMPPGSVDCRNVILGSNQVAVRAAAVEAERRGFQVIDLGSENCGLADDHGIDLQKRLRDVSATCDQRVCVLAGGETTVQLAKTDGPQKGGRNQQAVLAAMTRFPLPDEWKNLVLLSGGTDGEDGPTDAAGAFADESVLQSIQDRQLSPVKFLATNNAYPFLDQIGGLLKTGPSHTNVMDLAVGLFDPTENV